MIYNESTIPETPRMLTTEEYLICVTTASGKYVTELNVTEIQALKLTNDFSIPIRYS